MATALQLSVHGIGQTASNLRRAGGRVKPLLVRQVERETIALQRDIRRNSMTGAKGSHPLWGVTGAAGNALGARSNKTRDSVLQRVFVHAGTVVGVVGSAFKQMKLHEEGGTISGKPYLRIPTKAMQTGAGVDRNAGRSIRGTPGMFLFRSANGRNLWAAFRQGKALVLAYLLVRQVHLRARHIFRGAKQRNEPGIRARMKNVAIQVAIEANGGR